MVDVFKRSAASLQMDLRCISWVRVTALGSSYIANPESDRPHWDRHGVGLLQEAAVRIFGNGEP